MTIDTLSAVNAYRNQLKMQEGLGEALAGNEDAKKASFSDLLKEAASGAIENQRHTEAVSMESLTGKVELSDLVTAVSSAELTLNTVVAVRDRVISAYQEITRMPI